MKTKLLLTSSLIAGILHFFLGWLVYGILLMDTMKNYTNASLYRADNEMIFWSILVGSISFGVLLSYVLLKFDVKEAKTAMFSGGTIGLLMAAYMNFTSYGTALIYTNLTGVMIDVFAGTLLAAVIGFCVGLYIDKAK